MEKGVARGWMEKGRAKARNGKVRGSFDMYYIYIHIYISTGCIG